MKTILRISTVTLLFLAGAMAVLAQATIPVGGNKATTNVASQLLTGNMIFTVTDTSDNPVTYTPQGGSPSSAAITIAYVNGAPQNIGGFPPTIPNPATMSPSNTRYRIQAKNSGGTVTYYTLPLTNITLSNWSFDSYTVPPGVVATGIGLPQLPCSPGGQYSNLSASDPYNWVCSSLRADGSVYWTQNPVVTSNLCPNLAMALVSPRTGGTFCVDSMQAWITQNLTLGNLPSSAPSPFQVIPFPASTSAPTGPAGGRLAGTYPNPTLANSGVTAGTYTNPTITILADGTISVASNGSGGTSPLTTKGDIYVFGTANARLPVGADRLVPTADSTATLGISYQTVVRLFTAGDLSPLFTSGVANGATTPALTFTASSAAQNAGLFGPASGGAGAYSFRLMQNVDLPTQSANTVLGALTATKPSGLAMPSCSGGSNALIWTTGVGFGCNTIAGGGSSLWSALLNPTGNLSLSMSAFTTLMTWGATTGSGVNLFTETDTTGNTGTGILHRFTTASSSSLIPWQADSNGCGWRVAADGTLQGIGCTRPSSFSLPVGTGSLPALPAFSAGWLSPLTGGTSYLLQFPATITAGIAHIAAPASVYGVNVAQWTSSPVNLATEVTGLLGTANAGTGNANLTFPSGTATLPKVVAQGTIALATSAIASGACQAVTGGSVNSVAIAGMLSTDVIKWSANGSLKAITGFVPSTNGGLSVEEYPTAGNANWDVCNWSALSVTPGAVTLNYQVLR